MCPDREGGSVEAFETGKAGIGGCGRRGKLLERSVRDVEGCAGGEGESDHRKVEELNTVWGATCCKIAMP